MSMKSVKTVSLFTSYFIILRKSAALSASIRSLRLCAFRLAERIWKDRPAPCPAPTPSPARAATSALKPRRARFGHGPRGRSRNTSGFEPYETFELAPQELIASAQTTGSEQHDICLEPTQGSPVFQWVQSSMGDQQLSEAASRCVLLHGLFEVWGHGRNKEEAAEDASRSGRFLRSVGASWSLGVTSYGRSSLRKDEQQKLAGGAVDEFLSTFLKGQRTDSLDSDIRIRVIEDTCPPPAANLPRAVKETEAAAVAAEGKRSKSTVYICRELAVGAAVGEGGTTMSTSCGRRPIRGVLGALALNRRRCRGRTAIEPEVALVMANLAKVRPGSRVLDPFCGSCSLLLPAANMGANTWGSDVAGPAVAAPLDTTLGPSDHPRALSNEGAGFGGRTEDVLLSVNRENLGRLYKDFEGLGISPPTLVAADIRDQESPIRKPEFYDAIVTDPPYNIKAKVIITEDPIRERENSTNLLGSPERKPARPEAGPASPAAHPDSMANTQRCQIDGGGVDGESVHAEDRGSEWRAGGGARAEACANNLVGEVIWSLLSLARYSLKPGGRLCFFLPLRGADARLVQLPNDLMEKLTNGDHDAGGTKESLSLVYATKQRMTSPNICRWLLVLEKERRQLRQNR